MNGQPDVFKALWSHGDDATVSGGLGGVIAKGWTQVSERLDWVATQYLDAARIRKSLATWGGLAFESVPSRSMALSVKLSTGDGTEDVLFESGEIEIPCGWSPDGRFPM